MPLCPVRQEIKRYTGGEVLCATQGKHVPTGPVMMIERTLASQFRLIQRCNRCQHLLYEDVEANQAGMEIARLIQTGVEPIKPTETSELAYCDVQT